MGLEYGTRVLNRKLISTVSVLTSAAKVQNGQLITTYGKYLRKSKHAAWYYSDRPVSTQTLSGAKPKVDVH